MSHLVLGADDSVLREFTELHVVLVHKRNPEGETESLQHQIHVVPTDSRRGEGDRELTSW